MTPEVALDPRILAALIGGLVVAMGWVIASWRERGSARRTRLQREADLRIALGAEIEAHVKALRFFDLEERWRRIVLRMEDDADYVPLIPITRANVIFTALIAEVQVLPQSAIEPMVRYYTQLQAIEAMVMDMRSVAFRRLAQDRRIAMYTDYISLTLEARELGELAITALRDRPSTR